MKTISSTKTVPKVNEDLDETEFQVEIPYSETLANFTAYKSLKVKLTDEGNKELVSHYFYPADLQTEDGSD